MRTRKEIEDDYLNIITTYPKLPPMYQVLEVLLDIRDLLNKGEVKPPKVYCDYDQHIWKDVSYGIGEINRDTICDKCGVPKY